MGKRYASPSRRTNRNQPRYTKKRRNGDGEDGEGRRTKGDLPSVRGDGKGEGLQTGGRDVLPVLAVSFPRGRRGGPRAFHDRHRDPGRPEWPEAGVHPAPRLLVGNNRGAGTAPAQLQPRHEGVREELDSRGLLGIGGNRRDGR